MKWAESGLAMMAVVASSASGAMGVDPIRIFAVNQNVVTAAGSQSGPLVNHNGGTLAKPTVLPLFWGPSFTGTRLSQVQAGMKQFYGGLTGTGYLEMLRQYFGGASTSVTIGTAFVDTSSASQLSSSGTTYNDVSPKIQSYICTFAQNKGLTASNLYIPVYTDLGGSGTDFCAFHGSTTCNVNGQSVYINYGMFWSFTGNLCTVAASNGRTSEVNTMADVSVHELMEMMTDPTNGWYTASGYEGGDLCQSDTTAYTLNDGSVWTLQSFWDNSRNSCSFGGNPSPVPSPIQSPVQSPVPNPVQSPTTKAPVTTPTTKAPTPPKTSTPRPTPKPTSKPVWSCPNSWYGTGDGCDCECGGGDPDCQDPYADLYCRGSLAPTSYYCNAADQCVNSGDGVVSTMGAFQTKSAGPAAASSSNSAILAGGIIGSLVALAAVVAVVVVRVRKNQAKQQQFDQHVVVADQAAKEARVEHML